MRCWATAARHDASPSHGSVGDEPLQGLAVGREHHAAGDHRGAVTEPHPYAVRPVLEGSDLRARAHVDPEPGRGGEPRGAHSAVS